MLPSPPLLSLLLLLLTATAATAATEQWTNPHAQHPLTLEQILTGTHDRHLYTYPTDFTQGIVPKGVHSHNDYWRRVPFYDALGAGAVSVEADVWLYNSTLYVGHEPGALTHARTFSSLYVQPILDTVRRQNPNTSFTGSEPTRNGVFDTDGAQTLYLFVDVKTNGATTWPAVVAALQPLRAANYLTTFDGTNVAYGPVTVIGTGNTPLDQVQGVAPRDYFYDGPLPDLDKSNITASVSPIASTDFLTQFGAVRNQTFTEAQMALLQKQVAVAHAKGIKVRYWDQPGWPIGTRNAIWRILWDAGVDLLNVDDLEGVANFWQNLG